MLATSIYVLQQNFLLNQRQIPSFDVQGDPQKNVTHEYINIFSPIQAYSLHFQLCREEYA